MKNVDPGNNLILKSTHKGKTLMLRWLLPTVVGVLALVRPTEAATLESWQFEVNQNQLSFTTEGAVQPKAQLIGNPIRLIIDLPGTTLGGIRTSQVVGGAIKAVRVGQFNAETARIVVELNSGYTIDPKQVKFRGISASEWTVQIPTPQKIGSTSGANPVPQSPPPPAQPPENKSTQPPRRIETPTNPNTSGVNPLPQSQPAPAQPPENKSTQPPRRIETPTNPNTSGVNPLPQSQPAPAQPPENKSTQPPRRIERAANPNTSGVNPLPQSPPAPASSYTQPPRRIERPTNPSSSNQIAATGTPTLVENVQVKKEGVVLQTSGKLPEIELKQSVDRTWMTIDVINATLKAQDVKTNQRFNDSGLAITQLTQLSASPAVVRLTLSIPDTNVQWQARAYAGGVAVWPQGAAPPTINQATDFAVIESVELKNGTELVITGDKPLNYTSGWDSEADAYGITVYHAKVDDRLKLPSRQVGSPLLWAKIRQEDPETVTILLKPATNVQIASLTQLTAKQLSLPMGWGTVGTAPPGWQPNPAQQPSSSRPPLFSRGQNSAPPPQTPQNSATTSRPFRWPFSWPRRNQAPSNTPPLPLPNQLPRRDGQLVIVIDPGHGGPTDLGGVGIGGLREKDIVLPISLEVAQILQQNGMQVVLTRETDRDLDLPPRSELANRVGADLFVSIHANAISMSRPDVNGLETFYYQSGQSLAQYIQNSMLESFPTMNNRGVKQARFHVLRNTQMPAVLVEVGFVTGNYDAQILADPGQRSRMAQAIARGILQYVQAYSR